MERRFKAGVGEQQQQQQQPQLKCPRCDSLNTKFCYFNNYSQSQPRHFCKNCRRYWTAGGSLRNVPVGGGCRKTNKRPNKQAAAELQPQPQSGSITHAAEPFSSAPSFYSGSNVDLAFFARTPPSQCLNLSDDQPSLASPCSMGLLGSAFPSFASRLPSLGSLERIRNGGLELDFPANLCLERSNPSLEAAEQNAFSLNGIYPDWNSYQEKTPFSFVETHSHENNYHEQHIVMSRVGEKASCITDSHNWPPGQEALYGHAAEIDYCTGWPDLVQ